MHRTPIPSPPLFPATTFSIQAGREPIPSSKNIVIGRLRWWPRPRPIRSPSCATTIFYLTWTRARTRTCPQHHHRWAPFRTNALAAPALKIPFVFSFSFFRSSWRTKLLFILLLQTSELLSSWSPHHPYLSFPLVPKLELPSTTSFRACEPPWPKLELNQPSKLQPLPSSSVPERRGPSLQRCAGENPPLILSFTASRRSAQRASFFRRAAAGSLKKKTETKNCQLSYIVLVHSSILKIHIK
jgi:hypothetical protein